MERVAPVVEDTIRALAKVRFVEDPIAGVRYSRATSIISSATSATVASSNLPFGRAYARATGIRSGMMKRSTSRLVFPEATTRVAVFFCSPSTHKRLLSSRGAQPSAGKLTNYEPAGGVDPLGEDFWILKIAQGPFPESAQNLVLPKGVPPDLWVT